MRKPQQANHWYRADATELAEALEYAMDEIASAMESLRGFEEFQDWFGALSDLHDDMFPAYEEYETEASVQYAEQVEELRRDYVRGLL